jgi:hypothetical protein
MDERLKFIARLLEGERMAPLCREFGISRVTGYKIFDRYKECGLHGLYDRSRAPYRQANRLPFQVERTILGIKKEHPSWGAPKIRDKLIRLYPMIPTPAVSTIHAVLDRNGLVKRRHRARHKAQGTALLGAHEPNGLWCADYKGEFMLGNRQYCYPLTISDYRSRYLLACEGLESTKSNFAFSVFERTFKDFGLPAAIRTDNGTPFAAPCALFGLSKLAVRRAPAPGTRRRLPWRALYTFNPHLRAASGARLPLSRPHHSRNSLRSHLLRASQGQLQCRLCRAARRHPRGRRSGLAGQLSGVRSGLLRQRRGPRRARS